jgi:hypothetical protein
MRPQPRDRNTLRRQHRKLAMIAALNLPDGLPG